jgi:4-phospho-D-threonate 3-dehydrogenase / 4-phospho-D-erythronate 3-dehydrogenase
MKYRICLTMGDPAGIGAEIIVKALADKKLYDACIPLVIGDKTAMQDALSFTHSPLKLNIIDDPEQARGEYSTIDCIDLGYLAPGSWEYKKVQKICGEASFQYVVKSIQYAMAGKVQAVVTGPINKESINIAGYHYAGQTEIFANYTHTVDYGMLLTSPDLRVIHVTTHMSMRQACDTILNGRERIEKVIGLANEGMHLLGIENPRIAVAGLNAHCSENGLFGIEEKVSIIPAIESAKAKGLDVDGPIPPDTVFVKAVSGKYDVVVAMYHDQGHIPLKLRGFKLDLATDTYTSMVGVNSTIGLPIIRTSVDHGTAYDKAGEGRANEESLIDAVNLAITMAAVKFGK